jgi:Flp pilus assembly protein TadD
MKRTNTMKFKNVLLAQTGLALVLLLSGAEIAAAQSQPSPVSLMPTDTPSGSATSIDAPMPGTAATTAVQPASAPVVAQPMIAQPATMQPAIAPIAAAPATTQTAVSPMATTTPVVAAPASTTVVGVPATATVVGVPTTVAPGAVAQETLPVATKAEAANQPSAAELAVVHAGIQPGMAPATGPATGANGGKVADMLKSEPATVRPLPKQYLVVKKERNANDFDARLMAARSSLAQGSYQSALELFDDLYKKNPTDMRVLMGRAVALQKLGQVDEAMSAYQGALRKDPRNVEAMTNMLGMLKGKDAPTAIKKLQQLRELYPANADVAAQLGMIYGVTGDYNNAIKYLDMADSLKPGSPTVLYNRAVAYDHMGNTTQAATLYRQILLLASDGDLDQSFPLEVVRQRLANMR